MEGNGSRPFSVLTYFDNNEITQDMKNVKFMNCESFTNDDF